MRLGFSHVTKSEDLEECYFNKKCPQMIQVYEEKNRIKKPTGWAPRGPYFRVENA
jgi:hypothetical protein